MPTPRRVGGLGACVWFKFCELQNRSPGEIDRMLTSSWESPLDIRARLLKGRGLAKPQLINKISSPWQQRAAN